MPGHALYDADFYAWTHEEVAPAGLIIANRIAP